MEQSGKQEHFPGVYESGIEEFICRHLSSLPRDDKRVVALRGYEDDIKKHPGELLLLSTSHMEPFKHHLVDFGNENLSLVGMVIAIIPADCEIVYADKGLAIQSEESGCLDYRIIERHKWEVKSCSDGPLFLNPETISSLIAMPSRYSHEIFIGNEATSKGIDRLFFSGGDFLTRGIHDTLISLGLSEERINEVLSALWKFNWEYVQERTITKRP